MFVESARRPFSLSGFTTSAASWSCCIVLRDVWHASDFRSRCQNPSQHAIFIIRMAYANRESLLTFACRRCESNQGFLKPCLDSAGVNIACLERWTMNEDVRSSSWTWGVFIAVPMFVCLKIRKPTMQVQQMVCRFPQKLAVLICIYIYIFFVKNGCLEDDPFHFVTWSLTKKEFHVFTFADPSKDEAKHWPTGEFCQGWSRVTRTQGQKKNNN